MCGGSQKGENPSAVRKYNLLKKQWITDLPAGLRGRVIFGGRGTDMSDLIDRQALLKQIDIDSDGEPGYYGDTWKFIDTIKSMPPAEHGTNLAEVGTDCISREQAIEAFRTYFMDGFDEDKWWNSTHVLAAIEGLPPAEPDIIYCKDCSKHNKRIGDYVENSDGTYCWIWKGQACPLAEFRGVAQGHEFDYQFCAYGERRTE